MSAHPSYYGGLTEIPANQFRSDLFLVLNSYHTPRPDQDDLILDHCEEDCYKHQPVTYKKARELLFGALHLEGDAPGTYHLLTYYCQVDLTNSDLSPSDPLAPNNIPDHTKVNTEHVWPQSKFSKDFPGDLQKADLHILLPELSGVNSTRNNHPYGHVVSVTSEPCAQARLGKNENNQTVFEPAPAVRGDVARATFYFSVRYKMPIDATQEAVLRQWHQEDPVDDFEISRHERIFRIQKNRNPFIDHPEWVDPIADF